jgi:ribosomal protein S18 acetylase RimI-like enzyme
MTAPPACHVRRLTHADLAEFRSIRLEALRLHPEAFSSSFEEENALDAAAFARFVPESPPGGAFGAFVGGSLQGIGGLFVVPRPKQRHKGTVVSIYVRAGHRAAGLGQRIMAAIITDARTQGLTLLQLTVTVGNEPAIRLYRSLGFQTYGLERRALRVAGVWFDDELMALDLD